MASDPAFLFYPGDYLRDTQCLSEKSQVAYDRIMCEHMRNISITNEQFVFFTKRLSNDERDELKHVLIKTVNGWQIKWVAESVANRLKFNESRRKNRLSKPKTSEQDMFNTSQTSDPHKENENENESINDTANEVESLHVRLKNFYFETAAKKEKTVTWDGRKGKSLNGIIDKINVHCRTKYKREGTPEEIFNSFKHIITHLPEFYERSFEINDVNSGFDRIINTIKSAAKTGNGKGKADNANVSSMFAEIHRQRRASSAAKDAVN